MKNFLLEGFFEVIRLLLVLWFLAIVLGGLYGLGTLFNSIFHMCPTDGVTQWLECANTPK
jgi:hypothetical protein